MMHTGNSYKILINKPLHNNRFEGGYRNFRTRHLILPCELVYRRALFVLGYIVATLSPFSIVTALALCMFLGNVCIGQRSPDQCDSVSLCP
jgi:hypothetical protein